MMLEYFCIPAVALLVSVLTLFSGFGLGTLLMPVMALFFPLEIAVIMTALVHVSGNVFKLFLMGRHRDPTVTWRFGIPAVLGAVTGAWLLSLLSWLPPLLTYSCGGHLCKVSILKLIIAVLMVVFALQELFEGEEGGKREVIDRKTLLWGGLLSGFLGGLSGHQGAIRSAFLMRCGLGREAFIGTGVVIACMVDVTRIFLYAGYLFGSGRKLIPSEHGSLLLLTCLAAWVGAFVGKKLMKKVTLRMLQRCVAVMLCGIAVALALGWI